MEVIEDAKHESAGGVSELHSLTGSMAPGCIGTGRRDRLNVRRVCATDGCLNVRRVCGRPARALPSGSRAQQVDYPAESSVCESSAAMRITVQAIGRSVAAPIHCTLKRLLVG